MNRPYACLLVLGLMPCSMASAELPYTFNAGDPIRASELNANFQYLESVAASGVNGVLIRRKADLSTSRYVEVATVPDSATEGWVLRSFVASCSGVLLRINDEPGFVGEIEAELVVRPGETLSARCPGTASDATLIGYFMFNEQ